MNDNYFAYFYAFFGWKPFFVILVVKILYFLGSRFLCQNQSADLSFVYVQFFCRQNRMLLHVNNKDKKPNNATAVVKPYLQKKGNSPPDL